MKPIPPEKRRTWVDVTLPEYASPTALAEVKAIVSSAYWRGYDGDARPINATLSEPASKKQLQVVEAGCNRAWQAGRADALAAIRREASKPTLAERLAHAEALAAQQERLRAEAERGGA